MTIEISINGWQGKPDGMRIRNVNVNHLGRPEVMGRYSEANDWGPGDWVAIVNTKPMAQQTKVVIPLNKPTGMSF